MFGVSLDSSYVPAPSLSLYGFFTLDVRSLHVSRARGPSRTAEGRKDAEPEGLILFVGPLEMELCLLILSSEHLKMTIPAYDIFKNEKLGPLWIEAIHDIPTAKARIEELARQTQGEYLVIDQRRGQIVANVDSRTSNG
jgi:hypothetical protein